MLPRTLTPASLILLMLLALGTLLPSCDRASPPVLPPTTTQESQPNASTSQPSAVSEIRPKPTPKVAAADIFAIEFARDGRLLVARRDGITLHDLSSGSRQALAITLPIVRDVNFSLDGQSIVFAAGDVAPALIWSLAPASSRSLAKSANAVRFSPDGRLIATGHSGGELRLWDAIALNNTATVRLGVGPVRAIAFAPSSGALAAAGQGVAILELPANRLRTKLGGADCPSIAYSPDGHVLAAAGESGVSLWETVFWQRLATLSPGQAVTRVGYWRGGTTIVMSFVDGSIQLWDTTARQRMMSLPARGSIVGLALSPDDRTLATATGSSVTLWDTTTREPRPLP